jgi:hypothetical protein
MEETGVDVAEELPEELENGEEAHPTPMKEEEMLFLSNPPPTVEFEDLQVDKQIPTDTVRHMPNRNETYLQHPLDLEELKLKTSSDIKLLEQNIGYMNEEDVKSFISYLENSITGLTPTHNLPVKEDVQVEPVYSALYSYIS